MARPVKQTVDYFPHYVNHGKTLLILENEFGNDGYAFWFKLLELLCTSEGQVYDYNNPASWRFLLAKTLVNEDIANKILQTLSDLRAIDPELHQGKIIWSQNLIENLDLVYKRRSTGTPERPVIVNKNALNVNKKPQTKLNNTKLNNTKLNNTIYTPLKQKLGEFLNVLLTTEEYGKLVNKFGEQGADDWISSLSEWLKSTGKVRRDHYATILNWERRERKEKGGKGGTYKGQSRELKPRSDYKPPEEHRSAGR